MGLIELYILFAVTTAIMSLIDIFIPVVNTAIQDGVDNEFTQNPKLSYFVYFFISLITAPVFIIPLVVPSLNVRMYVKMLEIVSQE